MHDLMGNQEIGGINVGKDDCKANQVEDCRGAVLQISHVDHSSDKQIPINGYADINGKLELEVILF